MQRQRWAESATASRCLLPQAGEGFAADADSSEAALDRLHENATAGPPTGCEPKWCN